MIGYRRPPNLKDKLCRAEIRTREEMKANKDLKNNILAHKLNFPLLTQPKTLKQSQISDFFKGGTNLTTSQSTLNLDLTPTQTTSKTGSQTSVNKINKNLCRNYNCKICPFLDTLDTISSHVTGEIFPAKTNITCHSSNLIYCIICKVCGLQYVGQTQREISQRFQEHLLNIKHMCSIRNNPNYQVPRSFVPHSVGQHFSGPGHTGQKDAKVKILDFVNLHPLSSKAKIIRLKTEKKWIHSLRTPAPQGMNMQD
jgi:hypothetical protein